MGGSISLNKINFEDVQSMMIHGSGAVIISTLPVEKQDCLIQGTLSASEEVTKINEMLSNGTCAAIPIIVYGENSCDDTLRNKCNQLIKLGFGNVYIYVGGLFEWLLLQDIYGAELFPTTRMEKDLLKFKGRKIMNMKLLSC